MRRLIPHPLFTLFLTGYWLLLVNELSLAQGLLGLLQGLLLPLLTARFAVEMRTVARWGKAMELAGVFLYDLVVANLTVAAYVLGLKRPIRPAFVEVKLDIRDTVAVALLAAMVTLTPGTVSVDLDRARGVLLIHALVTDDPKQTAQDIKTRYESRLKEIFRC
jgi:multicomponent K+:H+ antiporter subunit E